MKKLLLALTVALLPMASHAADMDLIKAPCRPLWDKIGKDAHLMDGSLNTPFVMGHQVETKGDGKTLVGTEKGYTYRVSTAEYAAADKARAYITFRLKRGEIYRSVFSETGRTCQRTPDVAQTFEQAPREVINMFLVLTTDFTGKTSQQIDARSDKAAALGRDDAIEFLRKGLGIRS